MTTQDMLRHAYAAYNRQDSEALLALVREDIDWPNGSARLHGKAELRSYWVHQWTQIRTHDEVTNITEVAPDVYVVHIDQTVRTLDGSVISRGQFDHIHRISHGLIAKMDIQNRARQAR